jgi:hypothetical protein
MSGRVSRPRGLLLTLGVSAAILGTVVRGGAEDVPVAPRRAEEVARLRGSGWSDWVERAACVGCIGGIYASGGGSPLGIVVVGILWPEAIAGCGMICYWAAT